MSDLRPTYPTFARLFEYPTAAYRAHVRALSAAFERLCPEAAEELGRFEAAVESLSTAGLEELFFRTFDMAPQCAPYASVHLFGEESFKRAELMTGLAEAYAREGLPRVSELPDHLAVLLRSASRLPEWPELSRACLLRAVLSMHKDLEKARSPYAHVLRALWAALVRELDLSEEEAVRLVAAESPPVASGRREDGRVSPGQVLREGCGPQMSMSEEGARG